MKQLLTKEEQLEHINDLLKNVTCHIDSDIQYYINKYKNSDVDNYAIYGDIISLILEIQFEFYKNKTR
jgi:hypothetical protein